MEEGFRVPENRITAEIVTANFNYNNNIIIGDQAAINNNNNNGDLSTNNNTNNIELEGRKRRKTMPTLSSNEERSIVSVSIRRDLLARPCHRTKGVKLLIPTTKPVGQAFKTNYDKIWSLLMKAEFTSIGVLGMGGVGKTSLMTHINNQLLENGDTFSHVYWVTVSHDTEADKLQHRIATEIGFDLSKEYDMKKRAAKLYDKLIRKKKFVLILDDLWNPFAMEEIGIPTGVNGCKIIFTTRSLDVCRRMGVCEKNIIKVEPLSEEEAWNLFATELGDCSTKLEPLAKAVAKECARLPLGLKTMARSMRGVDDMREWNDALEELKEAEKREDDMERVFKVLRYSYDRLTDSTTQECFLYCAFFPEDYNIQREELIEYLIVEGIIEGKKSRQAKHNKGHVILNKLENACLLESCIDFDENRSVKMHDLIRDMAIQKWRERYPIMIKAGAQLKEIPDVEEWNQSLVRVSLMENYIKKIPSSHSPKCPNLATLLLRSNGKLKLITDSFFKQLCVLKVLDLSNTGIVKLPVSICELVSLIALLLSHCHNLEYIPTLAKLSKLQKLDLSYTGLRELPDGMEMLSNLRYLNIQESMIKEFRKGILPKLSHLEVLITSVSVRGEEVANLRRLECLECHFGGISDLRECMEHLSLSTYNIETGDPEHGNEYPATRKSVFLDGCRINPDQDFKAFPKDIEELLMMDCSLPKTLFGDEIRNLVSKSAVISGPPQSVGLFSCLKHLDLRFCDGVKRLFSIGLLSIFQNLERITVKSCHQMEEIQAMREEDDDDDDESRKGEKNNSSNLNLSIELPKLKALELRGLPKLKSICSGIMICTSLQEIKIDGCERLKRIPLSDTLPSLKSIQVFPKSWWESVEWDQLTDKNLLRPNLLPYQGNDICD